MTLGMLASQTWAATGVQVRVNPQKIEFGQTVQVRVTIEINPEDGDASDVHAPNLETDWNLVGRSQSVRSDGFSGRTKTQLVLTLQPLKTGRLVIGSFWFTAGGRTYKSSRIPVTVSGQAPQRQAPHRAAQSTVPTAAGTDPAATAAPSPDVFIKWEVSKTEAWLGEPLEARLWIYVSSGRSVSDVQASDINLEGFWNQQSTQQQRAERLQLGGRAFVREAMAVYTLYPIRSGTLSLPEVKARLRLGRRSFFGRGGRKRIERTARAVPISVKALPSAGRPRGFRGQVVGRLSLRSNVDRRKVRPDEGVQLTVVSQFTGLLQNLPEPELPDLADFKVFPPTHNERPSSSGRSAGATRRTTWLLKPLRKGMLRIPAIRIAYFDPATSTYARASTRPITIRVTGEAKANNTAASHMPRASGNGAGEDGKPRLQTIRANSSLGLEASPPYAATWYSVLIAAPPLLLLGLWLNGRMTTFRARTARGRAKRRAAREAQKRLEALRSQKDPSAVIFGVARAMFTYLESRFGEPLQGLTHQAMTDRLTELRVPRETINALITELDSYDFARFAPSSVRKEELEETIRQAQALVARIEESATCASV